MASPSVKAFADRMKTDDKFAAQVKECKTAAELLELTAAAGFSCTLAELEEWYEPLSDAELDCVVGAGAVDECTKPAYKGYIDIYCRSGRPNYPKH